MGHHHCPRNHCPPKVMDNHLHQIMMTQHNQEGQHGWISHWHIEGSPFSWFAASWLLWFSSLFPFHSTLPSLPNASSLLHLSSCSLPGWTPHQGCLHDILSWCSTIIEMAAISTNSIVTLTHYLSYRSSFVDWYWSTWRWHWG